MNKLMSVAVLACFIAAFGIAQEGKTAMKEMKSEGKWHGYIVDAMCAKGMLKKGNAMEKAAKHTRDCALEEACAASGYGVFQGGKYYKFDDAGDQKAKELIEKTSTEKGIMVNVTGKLEGDKIMVASISEMKAGDMDKMEKKSDSKMMMKKK